MGLGCELTWQNLHNLDARNAVVWGARTIFGTTYLRDGNIKLLKATADNFLKQAARSIWQPFLTGPGGDCCDAGCRRREKSRFRRLCLGRKSEAVRARNALPLLKRRQRWATFLANRAGEISFPRLFRQAA